MIKHTAIIVMIGAALGVNAQSIEPGVVSSSGTHSSNGTTQVSWTIGEPVIATYNDGSNILTQGFHQTLLTVTGIQEAGALQGVSVYPNPTNQLLNLRLDVNPGDITVLLIDASGRLILSEAIQSGTTEHEFDLSGISNGTYLLQLLSKEGLSATFNIQKVQR